VLLEIDPAKRLLNAALHTAGHVLGSALMMHHGYRIEEVSGANHLSPEQASVSFHSQAALAATHEELFAQVQAIIQACHPVTARMDGQNLRWVCIEGVGEELCCGTHLAHTGEIEDFALRKVEFNKNKEVLKVGYRARHRSNS
jgi:Ser-tRNA(Ala) deacylase AlaX